VKPVCRMDVGEYVHGSGRGYLVHFSSQELHV
jgi:hypothetical protein